MNTLIYTDASVSPHSETEKGKATIGLVILEKNLYCEYVKYIGSATSNTAELIAIIEALNFTDQHVSIFSDSLLAVDLINKKSTSKYVETQKLINRIYRSIANRKKFGVRTKINYIKGHSGNVHNEQADKLSRDLLRRMIDGSA